MKSVYAIKSCPPQPFERLPHNWRYTLIPVFRVVGALYVIGDYGEPTRSVSESAAKRWCAHHKLTFKPAAPPVLCDTLAYVQDWYCVGPWRWQPLMKACFDTGDWGALHEDIVAVLKQHKDFILTHVFK